MRLTSLFLSGLIALPGILSAATTDSTPQKPNIIFILSDDLGIGSVSSYGADNFKTPNIDKLAASGIRFEHCYASPLCGPSRALFLTGRYAFRTGMTSNAKVSVDLMTPANEFMIPRVLKQAGYVTGQVGKWNQLPFQPSDWGFDEYLRFEGSGKYWNTQPDGKTYTVNGKLVPLLDGEYMPDKMHEFAVDFITRHKNQPFFLYYPMSEVHNPILRTPDSAPGADGMQLYVDNVAYMDKLVGKLVDEVARLELTNKTIIVFASDNGTAPQRAKYCTIDGGKALSGHKNTMLECGALIPSVLSWPGTVPAGQVSQSLISFVDFLPTFAEITGTKPSPDVKIDGMSFAPLLHGQTSGDWQRDWIFVLLRRDWYDRETDWKLNQSGELFDMKNAPFTEPLVAADTKDADALAARQRLQTVLDQLNPAAGIMFEGKNKAKAAKNQPPEDSENANGADD